MDKELLEKLALELQREWKVCGLWDGLYREFFEELLKRYEDSVQESSKECHE